MATERIIGLSEQERIFDAQNRPEKPKKERPLSVSARLGAYQHRKRSKTFELDISEVEELAKELEQPTPHELLKARVEQLKLAEQAGEDPALSWHEQRRQQLSNKPTVEKKKPKPRNPYCAICDSLIVILGPNNGNRNEAICAACSPKELEPKRDDTPICRVCGDNLRPFEELIGTCIWCIERSVNKPPPKRSTRPIYKGRHVNL